MNHKSLTSEKMKRKRARSSSPSIAGSSTLKNSSAATYALPTASSFMKKSDSMAIPGKVIEKYARGSLNAKTKGVQHKGIKIISFLMLHSLLCEIKVCMITSVLSPEFL